MSGFNIRAHKGKRRAHFRGLRAQVDPRQKAAWDAAIIGNIQALPPYLECSTLLGYLPAEGEIDTLPLLEDAWRRGKRVAVPYCLPGTRIMEFYLIHSLQDLTKGSYGILEPDPALCQKLEDFSGCFCLAPGLAFDREGYRLGYGGGYYDRFLGGPYAGKPTAGACYNLCTVKKLPRGTYDLPCDYLITETKIKSLTPR